MCAIDESQASCEWICIEMMISQVISHFQKKMQMFMQLTWDVCEITPFGFCLYNY
jgi:hypothetical protein